jgi:hypothetical protein
MALLVNNRNGTSNHILPQSVVGNVHPISGYVSNPNFNAHVLPTGDPRQSNAMNSGNVFKNKALAIWGAMAGKRSG